MIGDLDLLFRGLSSLRGSDRFSKSSPFAFLAPHSLPRHKLPTHRAFVHLFCWHDDKNN
jgi:hypothetical protein